MNKFSCRVIRINLVLFSALQLWTLCVMAQNTASPKLSSPSDSTSAQISRITTAIDKVPNNPVLFYNRSILYQNQGKFTEAIQDLTAALRLDPNNTEYLILRARHSRQIGKLSEAEADLMHVLELAPIDAAAVSSLASIYRQKNQLDNALQYYDMLIDQENSYY